MRPYGYAIWENIQSFLDRRIKETGHRNAYFPQLIPLSFFSKEAEHVEGFAPELALVTVGGGKELEEPLALRPTSETIINHFMARWIRSHRDLPLLLNQWANVHRWEMRTKPFLRTLEFLWQEGHTAHANAAEAQAHARRMLGVYREAIEGAGAIAVVPGYKSRRESFAGAERTLTLEAAMRDGRALQAATSHYLGDRFAKAFDTAFTDETGARRLVQQTSFGLSTRVVGGILLAHGDDAGARLPPRLAPVQVVVVPIGPKDKLPQVLDACAKVRRRLAAAGLRVELDDDFTKSPGFRFSRHEARGVPLRLELGPRDLAAGRAVLVRRDVEGPERKIAGVPIGEIEEDGDDVAEIKTSTSILPSPPRGVSSAPPSPLVAAVADALEAVQASMAAQSRAYLESLIVDVGSKAELHEAIKNGKWARGWWAGTDEEEAQVQTETTATLRCIPFDQPEDDGNRVCFYSGRKAGSVALFARAH